MRSASQTGVGTIACSLAPSMGWLIAARAVAGAGGAGLLTVSSVITTDLTSLRSRGHYQGTCTLRLKQNRRQAYQQPAGLMMIVFGAGASLGGPVSGWIADVTNWRWSFVFQVRPSPLNALSSYLTQYTASFLSFCCR